MAGEIDDHAGEVGGCTAIRTAKPADMSDRPDHSRQGEQVSSSHRRQPTAGLIFARQGIVALAARPAGGLRPSSGARSASWRVRAVADTCKILMSEGMGIQDIPAPLWRACLSRLPEPYAATCWHLISATRP